MKDDRVYLQHVLDAIGKIESYVAVGRDVFMSASHWQDAVIRQLEIVGEATKNLSRGLRSRYPDIPWRRIAGLRDALIHEYMGVRLAAVWEVTQTDLPVLKKQISNILEESGTGHDQR
jgi:uncharacterized protein with HEPN domain